MKHWINNFDEEFLVIATFRYCVGRRTISACFFAKELAENWHILPENIQIIIKRELNRAFEEDDTARKNNETYLPLGMDCDRQAWQLVKNAYFSS